MILSTLRRWNQISFQILDASVANLGRNDSAAACSQRGELAPSGSRTTCLTHHLSLYKSSMSDPPLSPLESIRVEDIPGERIGTRMSSPALLDPF
jgi:hypothetical protein